MNKLIPVIVIIIFVIALVTLREPSSAEVAYTKPSPTSTYTHTIVSQPNISASQIALLVNRERTKKGLSTLKENDMLSTSAKLKAEDILLKNYWAHISPAGVEPWYFMNKVGYKFNYAGENLAKNFYSSEDVVRDWMKSPDHRKNILDPNFTEYGIWMEVGVLEGTSTIIIVQHFGAR